jgi:uracil-DNA glycosylase family 4
MDDRAAVVEALKRYLARRHRSGLDVVHRLDPAGASVHTVGAIGRSRSGTEGRGGVDGAGGSWRGGARGAVDERSRPEAARRDGGSGRKGTAVSGHETIDAAGGRTIEVGDRSIRYRHESRSRAQASLFSEEGPAEDVDVGGCDLVSLEEMVSACTRCPLSGTRNRTVFGSGSPDARIVFIGEAPGREEDAQGLPFVGRAGKLLTKILASVGMSRDEVYITNILKCRPPDNRDPLEDEVRACSIYLQRQIELIDPFLICALGRVAGQNLLRCTASLSVLRQNLHFYNDTKVIVTYHPAALLRNPNLKRAAWEDIKMVRRMYDEARESG